MDGSLVGSSVSLLEALTAEMTKVTNELLKPGAQVKPLLERLQVLQARVVAEQARVVAEQARVVAEKDRQHADVVAEKDRQVAQLTAQLQAQGGSMASEVATARGVTNFGAGITSASSATEAAAVDGTIKWTVVSDTAAFWALVDAGIFVPDGALGILRPIRDDDQATLTESEGQQNSLRDFLKDELGPLLADDDSWEAGLTRASVGVRTSEYTCTSYVTSALARWPNLKDSKLNGVAIDHQQPVFGSGGVDTVGRFSRAQDSGSASNRRALSSGKAPAAAASATDDSDRSGGADSTGPTVTPGAAAGPTTAAATAATAKVGVVNRSDILFSAVREHKKFPLAVFELGDSVKTGQLAAYAHNMARVYNGLNVPLSILGLSGGFPSSVRLPSTGLTLELSSFSWVLSPAVAAPTRLARASLLVWKDLDFGGFCEVVARASLAAGFHVQSMAGRLAERNPETIALRAGANVALSRDRGPEPLVLKCFPGTSARSLNLEMWRLVSASLLRALYRDRALESPSRAGADAQMTVLVTSYVPTVAPTIAHVLSLAQALATLADAGYVHGDVRAANVLCGEDGQAFLIDFDLGGKDGERAYVEGYNIAIDDGLRHPEARARKRVRFEHDIHSFLELVKHWRLNVCLGSYNLTTQNDDERLGAVHQFWNRVVEKLAKANEASAVHVT